MFEHGAQFRINISDRKISDFEAECVSLNYQPVGALNMEKHRFRAFLMKSCPQFRKPMALKVRWRALRAHM